MGTDVFGGTAVMWTALLFLGLAGLPRAEGERCTQAEYQRCAEMAEPLLNDPRFIFPDTQQDIQLVCSMWSKFVDCVKRYTEKCFNDDRRQKFNKAVERPVDSVHQMCMVSQYQTEYLKYATCIKSTLTEEAHCGRHYNHLVEQVSSRDATQQKMCCYHHRFRECVLDETKRRCDSANGNSQASRFARQMLDKALSFLLEECKNYIPNSADCPAFESTRGPGLGREGTTGSDLDAMQDTQLGGNRPNRNKNNRNKDRNRPQGSRPDGFWNSGGTSQHGGSATGWSNSPGSGGQEAGSWTPGKIEPGASNPSSSSSHNLNVDQPPVNNNSPGSSSGSYRPPYGRGTSSSGFEAGSWVPKGHSDSSTRVTGGFQTTETWYPNFNNAVDVDEPNQQGLSGKNSGHRNIHAISSLLLLLIVSVSFFT